MSLLNIVRGEDCVAVITDGVILNENALIAGFMQKAAILAPLNAVVAFRGEAMVAAAIANMISVSATQYATFDGMKKSVIADVKLLFAALFRGPLANVDPADIHMEVAVAGWSETDGPSAYYFHTNDSSPVDAWNIQSNDVVRVSPADSTDIAFHLACKPLTDRAIIEAAERQRRVMEIHGPQNIRTPYVGGFLQVTTVHEDRISTRVIHRWDEDRIGEPIKPSPIFWPAWNEAHVCGGAVAPLNSLQRERMEKKARKAAAR